jgi:hypothetical protein
MVKTSDHMVQASDRMVKTAARVVNTAERIESTTDRMVRAAESHGKGERAGMRPTAPLPPATYTIRPPAGACRSGLDRAAPITPDATIQPAEVCSGGTKLLHSADPGSKGVLAEAIGNARILFEERIDDRPDPLRVG